MTTVQQMLDLGGETLAAIRRRDVARDVVRTFHRCHAWSSFHLTPPLAGCGPMTPFNSNPYWPSAASMHDAWWFDIGGYQQAWYEAWNREAKWDE